MIGCNARQQQEQVQQQQEGVYLERSLQLGVYKRSRSSGITARDEDPGLRYDSGG